MGRTRYSYMAILVQSGEAFLGARGQVAFNTIGALKNSMNGQVSGEYDFYDYKNPRWEFYEIDSVKKTMTKINK